MSRNVEAEAELQDISVAEASPLKKWFLNNERGILGTSAVVIFLIAWELVTHFGLADGRFVSSPSRLYQAASYIIDQGLIWYDMSVSGLQFLYGMILAVILGISIGTASGWFPRFYFAINPFLSALYATPRVAFLPLIVLWVGLGIWSKILIVFLGAFFPIAVNTMSGIRTTDQTYLKMARSYNASPRTIFTTIALPGALPFILTGFRLAIGRGLVGIVVGELYAATAGVGYRLRIYGDLFQVDRMMVYIFIIAITGMILVEILGRVERRFEKWRPEFVTGQ